MPETRTIRAAAVQLAAEVGDIEANVERCRTLVDAAVAEGAQWVALPEFFSTGVGNLPSLRENAPGIDGAPARMMCEVAKEHGVHVGGSTLLRDADGHVRNAYLLAGPDGTVSGRHDKDIPTMWENLLYVGGTDDGRFTVDGIEVGIAMCWELMRTQTVRRLAGQVDLVLGGSGWWSIPEWPPKALTRRWEAANSRQAVSVISQFAPYVGAPIVHGAHAGSVECRWPLVPIPYRGHFQGGAVIADASGRVLAGRYREQGAGIVVADVPLVRTQPRKAPDRFWLHRRGAVAALAWAYQNPLCARRYRAAASTPARDEVSV